MLGWTQANLGCASCVVASVARLYYIAAYYEVKHPSPEIAGRFFFSVSLSLSLLVLLSFIPSYSTSHTQHIISHTLPLTSQPTNTTHPHRIRHLPLLPLGHHRTLRLDPRSQSPHLLAGHQEIVFVRLVHVDGSGAI